MHDFVKDTSGKKSFIIFRLEDKSYKVYESQIAKDAWYVFFRYVRIYGNEKKYILVMRSYGKFNCLKSQRILIRPAGVEL